MHHPFTNETLGLKEVTATPGFVHSHYIVTSDMINGYDPRSGHGGAFAAECDGNAAAAAKSKDSKADSVALCTNHTVIFERPLVVGQKVDLYSKAQDSFEETNAFGASVAITPVVTIAEVDGKPVGAAITHTQKQDLSNFRNRLEKATRDKYALFKDKHVLIGARPGDTKNFPCLVIGDGGELGNFIELKLPKQSNKQLAAELRAMLSNLRAAQPASIRRLHNFNLLKNEDGRRTILSVLRSEIPNK